MRTAIALLVCALLTIGAFAQEGSRSTKSELKGRGELRITNRGTERIVSATITHLPDNRFEVVVRGLSSHVFVGRILRTSGAVSQIRIEKAFGLDARDATGRLTRDLKGEVRTLNFGGKVGARVFEVLFTTQLEGPGPGGARPVLRDREFKLRGTGEVEFGGVKQHVHEATVVLQRNGVARIVLKGESDFTFRGRWREDGNDRVRLEVTEAFGVADRPRFESGGTGKAPPSPDPKDLKGTGWIELSEQGFTRIEINGSAKGFKFQGRFRAWNRAL